MPPLRGGLERRVQGSSANAQWFGALVAAGHDSHASLRCTGWVRTGYGYAGCRSPWIGSSARPATRSVRRCRQRSSAGRGSGIRYSSPTSNNRELTEAGILRHLSLRRIRADRSSEDVC